MGIIFISCIKFPIGFQNKIQFFIFIYNLLHDFLFPTSCLTSCQVSSLSVFIAILAFFCFCKPSRLIFMSETERSPPEIFPRFNYFLLFSSCINWCFFKTFLMTIFSKVVNPAPRVILYSISWSYIFVALINDENVSSSSSSVSPNFNV